MRFEDAWRASSPCGTQFDPDLADAFRRTSPKTYEITVTMGKALHGNPILPAAVNI
jgi:hypothetical protein